MIRSCVILKALKFEAPTRMQFTKINSRGFRRPRDNYTSRLANQPLTAEFKISTNKALMVTAGALGLGGLCTYGLVSGKKDSLSALDKMNFWPSHVKERIRSTYSYLAGSTAICAATALQLSKNYAFVARFSGGIAAPLLMVATSIGCGIVCRMIPYPADASKINGKHLAWLIYSASLGAMIAPICLLGGPILTQAALYTSGIVGGLSLVGACAPSDKFLVMAGPLGIGLGVVFVSSLGAMFANPVSSLGMGLHAVSLYGGLVLFSGFLLYDTQKIIHRAESTPYLPNHHDNRIKQYDPINKIINIISITQLNKETKELFGGSFQCLLPVGSTDISHIPDNQEVFINPCSKQNFIVDILESVDETDLEKASIVHFNEIALEANADQKKVLSNYIYSQSPELNIILLQGTQIIKKLNSDHSDIVLISMALYRYLSYSTDIIVYINNPTDDENAKPCSCVDGLNGEHIWTDDQIRNILLSFKLIQPSIFALNENYKQETQ